MEIDNIVDDLFKLTSTYLKGCEINNMEHTSQIIIEYLNKYSLTPEILSQNLNQYFNINFPKNETSINFDLVSNTLSLIFYLIFQLSLKLNESDILLSVKQSKNLKSFFKTLNLLSVFSKIQTKVPFHCELKNDKLDDFEKYIVLKNSVVCLNVLIQQLNLRMVMIPECLQAILVGSYQIAYCPLKKPTKESCSSEKIGFQMTENLYQELLIDKDQFKHLLLELESKMHPDIFLRETMILLQANSPVWFKKSVSQTLTRFIRNKPNGLQIFINTILGEIDEDVTKNWKALDVVVKIILSCKQTEDFKSNICEQLYNLVQNPVGNRTRRIFAFCTKELYKVNDEHFNFFLEKAFHPFFNLTSKSNENITEYLAVNIEILYLIFVENSVDYPRIPSNFLNSVIDILYTLYSVLHSLKTFANLKEILTTYLIDLKEFQWIFDLFLFNKNNNFPSKFDLVIQNENETILKCRDHKIINSVDRNARIIPMLLIDINLKLQFFKYLLNCLVNSTEYFPQTSELFPSKSTENMITVFQLLSLFAEDKNIQKQITEQPEIVLNYFEKILKDNLKLNVHKLNTDSNDFNTLFSVIMILHSLVDSTNDCFKNFEPILKQILNECENVELKSLVREILNSINKNKSDESFQVEEENLKVKTEFDQALEDICDPLLPTRGHGLMTLTKLVEKKDPVTMERKQYVLNIFLNNLKNDDSFIYLSAIGGLAAMSDLFTDTVLETLCEEYAEFKRQDNEEHEVRMKLGEVLVRTTKKLGDMAPKYKPLLLNTFLYVAKDDDELVRASSLSNLAEICRVLGTKLGTISSEILSCVFGIITGDKSIEARRAAVTVLRQLLAGLDNEMLLFLQDDMLPIYRTLKVIYRSDGDDVMRLQAQLALEQINDNMKSLQHAIQQQLAAEYCDTTKKSVVLK